MPRISLVGDHGGVEDYATIALWWAAESGVDYGSEIEAACLGACGSGYTLSGSSVNGAKVYTSGVVYDGTNDSSLATTDRLSLSANIDFDSIKIQSNNAFVAALNIASSANGCQLTKIVVEHLSVSPSGVDAIAVNSTVLLSLLANSIVIGGVNGIDYGFNAVLNVSNVVQFGAVSGDGFEGIGTNGTITDSFSFNNPVNDYVSVTTVNCASEDATGSVGLTGYTSDELVDFAGGDYRTKSTSDLATGGSGGSFIGAFLESGGGTAAEGNINFPLSRPTFTANGAASLPQPSGSLSFDISKASFSVGGSVTLPNPVGAINLSLSPPTFGVSGNSTLPQPVGSISTSLSAPSFVVSGSASLPQPVGIIGFTVDSLLVNASGSATSATPSGSISITINEPVFIGIGGATLPNPIGAINVNVSTPTFSATGSATIPSWSASGDITLSKPSFSVTGSTTLPQPSGSVELSLTSPVFNISGSVSGIVIINGTDSTISISTKPSLLTLETKSNTITI